MYSVLLFVVCVVGAYLVGGIPFGLIIAKAKGKDLRSIGSGNIGATNVARALGRRYGLLAFVLDAAKGALPVLFVSFVLPLSNREVASLLGGLVAASTIIGHIFSPYLKFRGGKGVATGAGATAALLPLPFLICASVWLIMLVLMRYVSLASISAAVALPLSFVILNIKDGDFIHSELVVFLYSLLIGSLVVIRHRSNIKRLLSGKEPKIGERHSTT